LGKPADFCSQIWGDPRLSALLAGFVDPVRQGCLRDAKILSYLPHRQVSTLDESDRVFFEFVVKSVDESSLS
jgi:hypothetical protein